MLPIVDFEGLTYEPPECYEIEEIGNYYGCLWIKKERNKFFWGIENYDGVTYVEIPKDLYDALIKHKKSRSRDA